MIDLDDFREEYAEALDTVSEFDRKADAGLPPDRWATSDQLRLIRKGHYAMGLLISTHRALLEAVVGIDDAD